MVKYTIFVENKKAAILLNRIAALFFHSEGVGKFGG
jgi:hypothetical protein